MRLLYRSFAFASLALCSAASAVAIAIERVVVFLIALAPQAARPAFAGPALARRIDGVAPEPSLRHRLRHEAGMSRRAAPRAI